MNANHKRFAIILPAVLIACLPIAIMVTFLLSPLWSWIEATYGIESIGHSGPSDWCFYAVYVVLNALVFAFIGVYLRFGKAKAI